MPETTDGLIRTFVLKVGQNTIDLPDEASLEIKPLGRLWWPVTEISMDEMEGILGARADMRGIPMIFCRIGGDRARFWPMPPGPMEARIRFRNEKTNDGSFGFFEGLDATPHRKATMTSLTDLIARAHAKAAASKPPPQPTQADVSAAEPTRDHRVTTTSEQSGPYQTLEPGAVFQIEPDLEWLTSEGPCPRRMTLTPDHGKAILERLRPKVSGFYGESLHTQGAVRVGHVANRLALANRLVGIANGESLSVYDLKPEEALYLAQLVTNDIYKVHGRPLSDAVLQKMLKPGGVITPTPRTDLDYVLDELRLAGVKCGVQVVSQEEVVVWTGDIQEALSHRPAWWPWGDHEPSPSVFHRCHGNDAIEKAAAWLREQRLLRVPPMSWTGVVGSGGLGNG